MQITIDLNKREDEFDMEGQKWAWENIINKGISLSSCNTSFTVGIQKWSKMTRRLSQSTILIMNSGQDMKWIKEK